MRLRRVVAAALTLLFSPAFLVRGRGRLESGANSSALSSALPDIADVQEKIRNSFDRGYLDEPYRKFDSNLVPGETNNEGSIDLTAQFYTPDNSIGLPEYLDSGGPGNPYESPQLAAAGIPQHDVWKDANGPGWMFPGAGKGTSSSSSMSSLSSSSMSSLSSSTTMKKLGFIELNSTSLTLQQQTNTQTNTQLPAKDEKGKPFNISIPGDENFPEDLRPPNVTALTNKLNKIQRLRGLGWSFDAALRGLDEQGGSLDFAFDSLSENRDPNRPGKITCLTAQKCFDPDKISPMKMTFQQKSDFNKLQDSQPAGLA